MEEGNKGKEEWEVLLDKHFEEKIDEFQTDHYKVIIKYKTFYGDPETIQTLYIEDKYLPLYPNGNNVKTVIEIKNYDDESFNYHETVTHDSWDGTGLVYDKNIEHTTSYGEYHDTETPWFFNLESLKENVDNLKSYHEFGIFLQQIQDYLKELMFPED
jgi:hypothetical protein